MLLGYIYILSTCWLILHNNITSLCICICVGGTDAPLLLRTLHPCFLSFFLVVVSQQNLCSLFLPANKCDETETLTQCAEQSQFVVD